jgi:hypothetical protein
MLRTGDTADVSIWNHLRAYKWSSVVLLSKISVTHGQPQSENIKWDIPEIIYKC